VRLSVVAANQPVTAKFHAVVPTSHGQVVGKFVAARDRQAGQKDLSSEIREARDIESYLPGLIRNHVKVVVTPLRAGFVRGVRAEEVEPGTLDRAVICVDRTAPRQARQRLHIGIILQVVCIAVTDINLVCVT
jgi:hypothetical protein